MTCHTDNPSASACECKRFDRKDVMPLIERRYLAIVKDIENFPIDVLADLLTNKVGSETFLKAVQKAKDYANETNTRFVVSAADLEALCDTFKSVDQHNATQKGLIHPHMRLRGPTSKAADSPCPEYFTEVKVSQTTGLKELYVGIRIGLEAENVIATIRGSKVELPI